MADDLSSFFHHQPSPYTDSLSAAYARRAAAFNPVNLSQMMLYISYDANFRLQHHASRGSRHTSTPIICPTFDSETTDPEMPNLVAVPESFQVPA
ncbi:hypothetical protein B0H14DRAFT_3428455 [Mycena olivaceomarginata]|nr:hypothetical protein B0H14DRAFT_3428455 [Mycena olivaceomarginata]